VVTPDDPETEPIKINARLEVTSASTVAVEPNPFDPGTDEFVLLRFTLEESARVRATVYDVTGAEVTTVQDGTINAGSREIKWDGKSSDGDVVASGVYFCHMEVDGASGFQKTFTIVLKKN
jgi:flagellar hook assembly protein FlgD